MYRSSFIALREHNAWTPSESNNNNNAVIYDCINIQFWNLRMGLGRLYCSDYYFLVYLPIYIVDILTSFQFLNVLI